MTTGPAEPEREDLRLYGGPSGHDALAWTWVESQLRSAGTYWVVARTPGHPHPRPVWGVWHAGRLFLSIGTPATGRALAFDPTVTVHLDSGTEVVIVEGRAEGECLDGEVLALYDEKYDWSYDVTEYGPLITVAPSIVLAWQTAGWAGRDGFARSGRWTFD
jgi:hypothetical protein